MSSRIYLLQGDITKIEAGAIVNAANSSLLGGGGVDGAIHRAGGKKILEECIKIRNKQGGCKTGEAVITTAGSLPAKYVIHTVGPVWSANNTNCGILLANAYHNSMRLAIEHNVETLAFPNISTGVYHFPKQKAAEIAVKTVSDFLAAHPQLKKVFFVCFDSENYAIYKALLS